ncbi:hypothetical protein DEJ50_23395 [Streptomyces venezuelae]|uniref:Uncharacterized protein n=1 Tax=Streptomyces venezuelae TaxID=54571 RepID=A0A5P2D5K8_STRVZ|nr:hypothetical protein DEJ50_23395 [Streptomyces venezuelae]
MTDSATLADLDPGLLGDMLRVAGASGYARWEDQIRRTGGCSDPIHITGWTVANDWDAEPDTVLVLASWQYAGHGHSPGESVLAATIARDIQLNRRTASGALHDQLVLEGAAS